MDNSEIKKRLNSINWNFDFTIDYGEDALNPFNCRKYYSYPATFIPEIPYALIEILSQKGDVVLDPFFGTGTTGAVAKKLGRHFIGIEKEKSYVEYAQKRIEAIQRGKGTLYEAVPKKEQVRVPFGALLAHGLLEVGTNLWDKNKRFHAVVKADGALKSGALEGSIHQVGAWLVGGGESINGWMFWHVCQNGKFIPIDVLRQKLNAQLKEQACD